MTIRNRCWSKSRGVAGGKPHDPRRSVILYEMPAEDALSECDRIMHRNVQNKRTYYAEDMDLLGVAEPAATVEDLVIYHQGIDSMWSAILQLPEKQRDLLYFKYILEMDDSVIAKILMITPASVRQYLTRARREAKQLMNGEVKMHAE